MLKVLPTNDSPQLAEQQRQALAISRQRAIQLGQHAFYAIKQGYYLHKGRRISWRSEVEHAVASKVSIPPDRPLPEPLAPQFRQTDVLITNESTLAIAYQLTQQGKTPLALNFASGIEPGGGFLQGGRAQEEALCRSSALYATLADDPMYEAHRQRPLPDSTDWAIYSPNVPVFCTEAGKTHAEPWPMNFISCAAPYAPRVGLERSSALLKTRIQRILTIARAYQYTTLVLGAWGCGAFGNDPKRTAQHFKQALLNEFSGDFAQIIFAIVDWSPERRFLRPFQDTFIADSL